MNIDTNQELFEQVRHDQALRRKLATLSHYWFFHIYFSRYIKFKTAEFQKELFRITEDETIRNAVIVAFRGSGKTTIMTTSYPIWAMLGQQQKKHIILVSQTQPQSQLILKNIKQELEQNELLLHDFGPFYGDADEWRANALVLPQFGCRISALSTGEGIRGGKHQEHRPDLMIFDDIEDLQSVKTLEGRDKVHTWLVGEALGAGDTNTRSIIIGNLLHEDGLMMRLKQGIELETFSGVFKAYPLVDDTNTILWPGKYPNEEAIVEEKKRIGSEPAFLREYMLKIVPDEKQVVQRDWLHYYPQLPSLINSNYRYTVIGVDLAISLKTTADFTAVVIGMVFGYDENRKIYIYPLIINERMDFPTTIEKLKFLAKTLGSEQQLKLAIESVGYQASVAQQLDKDGYEAVEFRVQGDKRERLSLVAPRIKNAEILFPETGCEELIRQLLDYPSVSHDDLIDAFTTTILTIIQDNSGEPGIKWLEGNPWGHDSSYRPLSSINDLWSI